MKSDRDRTDVGAAAGSDRIRRRRKAMETTAVVGLILICAGLMASFVNLADGMYLAVFRWVYAAGALTYTVARVVDVNDPADSLRLRRMRRMEAWAGVAFCVGAFFWFYNSSRFGAVAGSLAVLRDTIMFTLVGAIIQIIASWLISARAAKERKERL